MPAKPPDDDENLDALEFLSESAADPPPPTSSRPKQSSRARREKPSLPPLNLAPPPPPPPPEPREPKTVDHTPRYRCLNCGYPLLEGDEYRCSECGRSFDRNMLRNWYSDEERARFNSIIWFTVACLFLKLLLIKISLP